MSVPSNDPFADVAPPIAAVAPSKKPRLLSIDAMIAAVDTNDGNWLSRQSEDARKQFAGAVLLRWIATHEGSADAAALTLLEVNEAVNQHLWDLWEHPDLVFRLAATCGLGHKRRPVWLKAPAKAAPKSKLHLFIEQHYPGANAAEVELILRKYTKESFADFVFHETLCAPDEAREIVKAFNRR